MTLSPQLEAKFAEILSRYPEGKKRSAVVSLLMYGQDELGMVTPELVNEVAARTGILPVQVEECVTYYSMLHKKPLGKHHLQICTNISCMLTGGAELWKHACNKFGIGHREVTPDGQFSLEEVECIGACSWAPAIEVNYDFHHHVTPESFDNIVEGLKAAHEKKN